MTNVNVVKGVVGAVSLGAILAAGALALIAAVSVWAPPAKAAAAHNSAVYCQGYAQEAVRRYRDYVRNKCGNRVNNVWNPNYAAHYQYCMRTTRDNASWLQGLRYRVLTKECAGDGFRNSRR